MVKITFLGACREVGRSGVLIESEKTDDAVLCDYGTKFGKEQKFPKHVSGRDLSAIALTHAHVDHSGAIPLFYISGSVPLLTTKLTFDITKVLLKDMLRISSSYLPFEREEIKKMGRYARFLNYGERIPVGQNSHVTLINAGHIPGSAMVIVEMDEKTILYTGDINSIETRLLNGLNPSRIPSLDAIITETTYGTKTHNPREILENQLIEEVNNTYRKNGITLIPAFGVGRSQEIMMVLNKNGRVNYPITMDGMARKISRIFNRNRNMLKNGHEYKDALDNVHLINNRKRYYERRKAAQMHGVIIAPSGMLKGGTARFYSENVIDDPKNTINLVSYQVEGTPGRVLLEKGVYVDGDINDANEVQADVNDFDFSSHSGKEELLSMLEEIKFKGEKRVFCVHGDEENLLKFKGIIENLGYKTDAPIA